MEFKDAVAKLSLEDKVKVLTGEDFWTTWALPSINLRKMVVSDGPSGVRGELWDERSPMAWDVTDPVPAAQATVALLSDWFPKTTAEIIHVDGGYHAMGG